MNSRNEAELAEAVKRYYAANEVKKEAASEVKECGEEIKDRMAEDELTSFVTDGIEATLTLRTTKELDREALFAWLDKKGLRIPANCYVTKETVVLNVKAAKKAKAA